MTTSMISAEHLTYKRNRHLILDDLNLNVHQGHFIGLLGANGAGKTTLMRLLNGLATNFTGTIQIGASESIVDRKQLSSFSESLKGVNASRTLQQIAIDYAMMYIDFSEKAFAEFTTEYELICTKNSTPFQPGIVKVYRRVDLGPRDPAVLA